jgi:NADH pyrophosphatase NudC (nudix superfamily)
MSRNSQGLSELICRLQLLVAGLADGRRRDEETLQSVEREATELARQCGAMEKIVSHERDRTHTVLSQLKLELARAIHDRQRAVDMLAVELDESRKWRERYEWVDEERLALEKEIDRLKRPVPETDLLSRISDTQSCPTCGAPFLVAQEGDCYRCLHCSEAFHLGFGGEGVGDKG